MKRRNVAIALSFLLLSTASTTLFARSPEPSPPISGVVRHLESPVSGVLVILYNLSDTSMTRVRTAEDGTFVLAAAPVGVYDLIAYKRGFEPALQRLWHQSNSDQVSAVSIELKSKGAKAAPASAPTSIWELRDKLPTDVLREIGLDVEDKPQPPSPVASPIGGAPATEAAAAQTLPVSKVFNGDVKTMTNVASQSTSTPLSKAEVGLHGGLPNGWQYGIAGDYAVLGNGDSPGDVTTGNAAGIALNVDPSDAEHVVLSSRRNTLSFGDSPASLQTHSVTWSRGAEEGRVESVGARYFEETNLYRATAPGTTLFPLASRTWEVDAQYGRPATDTPGVAVGMVYRYKEASVGPNGVSSDGAFLQAAPDADLNASTSLKVTDGLLLQGGVVARYMGTAVSAYGIAPALTARYDFGPAAIYVRGLYRVAGSTHGLTSVMPRVASIEESQEPAATQSYAIGIERRVSPDASLHFEVSQQKMGELVRAFFEGDFLTDFDSVYLLEGNSVRQYQGTIEQRLSDTLSGSVAVRFGSIDGSVAPQSAAGYGIMNNAGQFWSARASIQVLPTHTGIALLVRGIRQNLTTTASVIANDSDKLGLSVAQDLSVIGLTPFGADWKLLVALEQAQRSVDQKDEAKATANRVLGGVAVSF
ncbi:MAG TPA: carboxypeptidase-like regulatory domain-containing protein [Thermoanaerobaculia bacterium]|nr:carboxypeptidase-like regulatory domain-containing protein [Thermoanaerobaculia bacterium]